MNHKISSFISFLCCFLILGHSCYADGLAGLGSVLDAELGFFFILILTILSIICFFRKSAGFMTFMIRVLHVVSVLLVSIKFIGWKHMVENMDATAIVMILFITGVYAVSIGNVIKIIQQIKAYFK